MTSTAVHPSQDLATFIKHNPPCDSQGVRKRAIPEEETITATITSTTTTTTTITTETISPKQTYYRRRTRHENLVYADPQITEDLLVLLKELASEDQHIRVEKIEVHEIYL